MTFSNKIIITSSLILIISLGLLSTNQYIQVRNQADQQIQESVDEILHLMSTNIQSVMQTKSDITAYAVAELNGDFSDQNFIKVFSKPTIKKHFLLAGLGRQNDGSWVGNDPAWSPNNYDPRKRMWFKEAKKQRKQLFTTPYADAASGEIMISFSAPLFSDDRFYGAIFTDVSLKKLADISNSAKMFDAGYAFIVSSDGNFIAHPDSRLNGQSISTVFNQPLDTSLDTPVALDLNGKKTWVQFKPVGDLGWFLGVALQDKVMFSAVNQLRSDAILYSLLAVIIAI